MIHATANIAAPSSASNSPLFHKLSVKRLIQNLATPVFNRIEMTNPQLAHWVCRLIPAQCPFERDVVVFGRKVFHIPPMCQINPVYEQFMELRFRALSFLADECGEDVTPYCR